MEDFPDDAIIKPEEEASAQPGLADIDVFLSSDGRPFVEGRNRQKPRYLDGMPENYLKDTTE